MKPSDFKPRIRIMTIELRQSQRVVLSKPHLFRYMIRKNPPLPPPPTTGRQKSVNKAFTGTLKTPVKISNYTGVRLL